jgi:putative SOS response-associated peptidase YedK
MCGKARSTTTPSKIKSIIKNAMIKYNSENTTSQENTLQENTLQENLNTYTMLQETDNIVPGMSMYVAYYNNANKLIIEEMKWGLYGFAGKSSGITFNSRIENIKSNFMSKKIQFNRGIIIIDGFYEKLNKTLNYITNEHNCIVVPVLFDIPSYGLNVFTLLTKPADENIQHIHTRQPVVLDELNLYKWMNMIEYDKKIIINNISNIINICEQPLTIVNLNTTNKIKQLKKKKNIEFIFEICEEPECNKFEAATNKLKKKKNIEIIFEIYEETKCYEIKVA